jgi:hypothetical protein
VLAISFYFGLDLSSVSAIAGVAISSNGKTSFELRWDLGELMGALRTASATQQCIAHGDGQRLVPFFEELSNAWGDPAVRNEGLAKLLVRMGRVVNQ